MSNQSESALSGFRIVCQSLMNSFKILPLKMSRDKLTIILSIYDVKAGAVTPSHEAVTIFGFIAATVVFIHEEPSGAVIVVPYL